MKNIVFLSLLFFGASIASAATVDLNDGRVVQGDILKKDDKALQISVDGVAMTYYADEIKAIDGKPFASSASTTAAPAPSAQPAAGMQAALATASQSSGQGPIDPDKKALILKFIDVFGTRQALNTNFELMLSQIEKTKPEEAANLRSRIKVDEIIQRLLPVYDRHFTSEELQAYITFYSSPEGHKLITTIPDLMKESVQESIKYMQEKFPEVKSGQ